MWGKIEHQKTWKTQKIGWSFKITWIFQVLGCSIKSEIILVKSSLLEVRLTWDTAWWATNVIIYSLMFTFTGDFWFRISCLVWKIVYYDTVHKNNFVSGYCMNQTKANLVFSKWRNFHPIRWIRQIGQNHPCMNTWTWLNYSLTQAQKTVWCNA